MIKILENLKIKKLFAQSIILKIQKNSLEIKRIYELDKFIDAYHTISLKTRDELAKVTDKPIYYIPLWVNQNIWFHIKNKKELRNRYKFDEKDFWLVAFKETLRAMTLCHLNLLKDQIFLSK